MSEKQKIKISLKLVEDRALWDEFLTHSSRSYFLQTWDWGDFYEFGLNRMIWRIGVYDGEKLIGVCLAVEEKSRFGSFVYCPRGPIISWGDSRIRCRVIDMLEDMFKGEKSGNEFGIERGNLCFCGWIQRLKSQKEILIRSFNEEVL